MTVESELFEALPPQLQADWMQFWTTSAEDLEHGLVVQRIADDDTGAGICLFLEGPDVGEVRVFLSADALCEGQHEAYLTALGVGVTQARFATGF